MTAKARAAALLGLVFVAGAFAGAGALRLAGPPPQPAEPLPGLEELDLDPSQRARAKAVLEKHRPELEAVLAEVEPRLRPVRDEVERELRRDVLTPAQAARLDALKASGRRPPGAGGP